MYNISQFKRNGEKVQHFNKKYYVRTAKTRLDSRTSDLQAAQVNPMKMHICCQEARDPRTDYHLPRLPSHIDHGGTTFRCQYVHL